MMPHKHLHKLFPRNEVKDLKSARTLRKWSFFAFAHKKPGVLPAFFPGKHNKVSALC